MYRANKKNVLLFILILIIALNFNFAAEATPSYSLSDIQKNSVAMLNYISFFTQEINSSRNSRIYLEEAYSSIINNTHPNAVDGETQNRLMLLLDAVESYRMIAVKRDRLKYLFEMNQAQAIRDAVPNPLALLNVVQSRNPFQLVASAVFMAIDSYTSYASAKTQAELQYLQAGWELDDEESATLHKNRKETFEYLLDIVRAYDLPGDLALSEKAINDFVTWKSNNNLTQLIQFFEANYKTYQAFGPYWLTLAEAYYRNEEYSKCLEAVAEYEKIQTRLFRRDYDFAKTLILALVSARECYDPNTYKSEVERMGNLILDNTDNEDWAIRYFLAQMYLDIAGQAKSPSDKTKYLQYSFDIILNNVNYLVTEQKSLNKEYLESIKPIVSVEPKSKRDPDDKEGIKKDKAAFKALKEEIGAYNSYLSKRRNNELAPIYEPLVVNCDLLFALAEELFISDADKLKIENILKDGKKGIFLISPLNDAYQFSSESNQYIDISITSRTLKYPLRYISDNSYIRITITTSGQEIVFDDWVVSSVERRKEYDIESFYANYSSQRFAKYKFDESSVVVVQVWPDRMKEPSYTYKFVVDKYKSNWIFTDTVEFRRVL